MTDRPGQSELDLIRMLQDACETSAPTPTDQDVTEYDWNAPSSFTPSQVDQIGDVAKQAGERIATALGKILRSKIALDAQPVTQHYVTDLREGLVGEDDYGAAVTDNTGSPCGLLCLSGEAAITWVEKLLGGSGNQPAGERNLSSLEIGLLQDIAGQIIGALSDALKQAGAPALQGAQEIAKAFGDLPGDDVEEYCKITFRQGEAESAPAMVLALRSQSLAGLVTKQADNSTASKNTRQDMLVHIGAAHIRAEVFLATASVTTRGILALEPGDVLFFHCRTLHAASRNYTDDTKFSVVTTFRPGDNPPVPGTRSASLPELLIPTTCGGEHS